MANSRTLRFRGGDEFRVLLQAPLEFEEFVITAAMRFRVFAAGERPRLVDRAVALVRIEELTDLAKVHIRLATHRVFLVVAWDRELLLCLAEAESEVHGHPFKVPSGQRNDGI